MIILLAQSLRLKFCLSFGKQPLTYSHHIHWLNMLRHKRNLTGVSGSPQSVSAAKQGHKYFKLTQRWMRASQNERNGTKTEL